ncbi:unnamed protein product [Spodoptera littoralis]|uniref:Uncharacterized protein n=1 Tax=Spodoptera littoralis TaxID=7109 RepID=A0A9P0IKI9_SPOLI|nr:unnamed protein product [Spodoptera littoralis]CAH1647449.1 unnamed protein product [Spodoptera littoralis]
MILSMVIVSNTGSVEDIYGDWVPVAFYPVATYIPTCLKVSFAKVSKEFQCSCPDAKNTTLFLFRGPGQSDDSPMFPVVVADPTSKIAEALNVSCRCGQIQYRHRKVAKQINNNYLVLYEMQNNVVSTADNEPISAQMFTREIPTYLELRFTIKSIDDFIYRNVGIMCTQEFLEAESRYKVLRQQGHLRDRSARSLRVQKFTYDFVKFITNSLSILEP